MNSVQLFSNEQFGEIRVSDKNGEPMFCLADVAKALGYSNPAKAVIDHCKGVTILETPTKNQHGTTVMQNIKFGKESDVYRLVMRSKLPEAEKFQDWICEEVLPSIRKHGGYLTSEKVEEALLNPDTIIQLAMQLKEERAEKERLSIQNDLQTQQLQISAPKVEYFDKVMQSQSTHNTNNIAKELGISAVTLNRKLRELGVQYLQGGQWLLVSKYQNKGYTATKTYPYTDSAGKICTRMFTVWTEAGRLQIHKWLGL